MKVAGSLDSNAILRVVLNDIPDQSAIVIELIEQSPRLAVCDVSVIETMFVLEKHYQFERKNIAYALTEIMKHPHLLLNEALLSEVLVLFAKQPALSPEDCYLAIYAKQNNQLPLWTFDKKLANQSNGLARELGLV